MPLQNEGHRNAKCEALKGLQLYPFKPQLLPPDLMRACHCQFRSDARNRRGV